jgi:hypothetical protein
MHLRFRLAFGANGIARIEKLGDFLVDAIAIHPANRVVDAITEEKKRKIETKFQNMVFFKAKKTELTKTNCRRFSHQQSDVVCGDSRAARQPLFRLKQTYVISPDHSAFILRLHSTQSFLANFRRRFIKYRCIP